MHKSRVNPQVDNHALHLLRQAAEMQGIFPHIESIASLDKLRALLIAHRIDLALWGVGSAKTVQHLWNELDAGEIWLAADPFRRVLAGVAQVIIRQTGDAQGEDRVLVDAEQTFTDGRQRIRNRPPAEKMLPGETYHTAALRCLAEEMRVTPERITLLPETHRIFKEIRTSQSYPGLLSQYTIHRVEAVVTGLPEADFRTEEDFSAHEHAVREHLWRWQPGEKWLN